MMMNGVSIFYCNDLHGSLGGMSRIKTMSERFDASPSDKTKLKFSSGDIMAGSNVKFNECSRVFMDTVGITAEALGNHNLDSKPSQFLKSMQDAKFKLLGINAHAIKNEGIAKTIERAYIEEKDGQKFGVIGIAPFDLEDRSVKGSSGKEEVRVDDLQTTIGTVQAQINEFKAQGVDKVIVLSHAGLCKDKVLAQSVTGIDVILGGHTHELVKDIKEGENLFYSPAGEPVIITQAGKDGEYAGILNVEFNESGVIKKVQNNVYASKDFERSAVLGAEFDRILGAPEQLGVIKSVPPPPHDRLVEPNPSLNFVADAMRSELDVDIALVNNANCRGYFEAGQVDSRKVFEVTPLGNRVVTLFLGEDELIGALKKGAESYSNPGHKPGIITPSGLKYTLSRTGEVSNVIFTDKEGKDHAIDVNNPNPEKTYLVAMDNFFASGGDGYIADKNAIKGYDQLFNYDKDKLACDYIKKFKEPIEIKDDGRITII